jgi:thioredoxin-related protein
MKKYLLYIFLSFNLLSSPALGDSTILNIDNVIQNILKEKKQTMIFFHMNNCGYCKRMEKETLQNKEIKNIIKQKFGFIDINVDDTNILQFNNKNYSGKQFSNLLDVNFFPTVIFLDNDNEITYKARGYRTIEKFKYILNYMKFKEFENMSFFDYLEHQDKE